MINDYGIDFVITYRRAPKSVADWVQLTDVSKNYWPLFERRNCLLVSILSKGQLISKCPFGFIVWTKLPTKLFLNFCPEIFVPSWGLPGSFLGLPAGFLVYDITY